MTRWRGGATRREPPVRTGSATNEDDRPIELRERAAGSSNLRVECGLARHRRRDVPQDAARRSSGVVLHISVVQSSRVPIGIAERLWNQSANNAQPPQWNATRPRDGHPTAHRRPAIDVRRRFMFSKLKGEPQ